MKGPLSEDRQLDSVASSLSSDSSCGRTDSAALAPSSASSFGFLDVTGFSRGAQWLNTSVVSTQRCCARELLHHLVLEESIVHLVETDKCMFHIAAPLNDFAWRFIRAFKNLESKANLGAVSIIGVAEEFHLREVLLLGNFG